VVNRVAIGLCFFYFIFVLSAALLNALVDTNPHSCAKSFFFFFCFVVVKGFFFYMI
jgi:hypothetical protein